MNDNTSRAVHSGLNYLLKVEYINSEDNYDDELEFRDFCASIVSDLNATNPNYKGEWTQITRDAARNVRRSRMSKLPSSSSLSSDWGCEGASSSAPRQSRVKNVRPAIDSRSFKSRITAVAADDIRMSIAKRLFNVFNGFDKYNLKSCLEKWCIPDCMFTVKWLGKHGNPCGPDQRAVRGVGPMTSFVDAIFVGAVPDAIMELLDSKLRVACNGQSFLLCKYSFKGSQHSKIRPVADQQSTEGSFPHSLCGVRARSPTQETIAAPLNTLKRPRLGDDYRSINNSSSSSSSSSNANLSQFFRDEESGVYSNTDAGRSAGSVEDPNAATALIDVDAVVGGSEVGDMLKPIVREFHTSERLPSIVRMSIIGTLILHINAEKMITRFEFIQECIHVEELQRQQLFSG